MVTQAVWIWESVWHLLKTKFWSLGDSHEVCRIFVFQVIPIPSYPHLSHRENLPGEGSP